MHRSVALFIKPSCLPFKFKPLISLSAILKSYIILHRCKIPLIPKTCRLILIGIVFVTYSIYSASLLLPGKASLYPFPGHRVLITPWLQGGKASLSCLLKQLVCRSSALTLPAQIQRQSLQFSILHQNYIYRADLSSQFVRQKHLRPIHHRANGRHLIFWPPDQPIATLHRYGAQFAGLLCFIAGFPLWFQTAFFNICFSLPSNLWLCRMIIFGVVLEALAIKSWLSRRGE